MKILILTNHLNFGGISAYVYNLAKMLHGKEDVEIIVASRGGDLEKDIEKLGVRHIRIPLSTKCEISPKVFLSFLKLRNIVKNTPIDVIHANTRVTQVLAALLSFFTRKPSVSTCHGYFKRRLGRILFPCWGKKVIAISDQVKDHLVCDFYIDADSIELVYNGVEIEKFHSVPAEMIKRQKEIFGLDVTKKIVGHIGRLSCVKGQKYLVLAAEILAKKRKDIQCLIVGDGGEEKELKRLIREKHLEKIVFLHPSVGDTSGALAVMDVFAMPSIQEGLGISILEAQAQGVPVVASRVGGIPTVIEDGISGCLVSPQDPEALATGIEKFLQDASFRNFVIQNAKTRVKEKFSLALMAKETLRVYRALL